MASESDSVAQETLEEKKGTWRFYKVLEKMRKPVLDQHNDPHSLGQLEGLLQGPIVEDLDGSQVKVRVLFGDVVAWGDAVSHRDLLEEFCGGHVVSVCQEETL